MNFIRQLINLNMNVYYRLSVVSEMIYAKPTVHSYKSSFRHFRVMIYANATGWSAIRKQLSEVKPSAIVISIIARGEPEGNYLICSRTLTSGIRVFYPATFNNLNNFQIC